MLLGGSREGSSHPGITSDSACEALVVVEAIVVEPV